MMALASIAAAGQAAVVVYLEDEVPVPAALRARLAGVSPLTEFIFTTDTVEQKSFTRAPAWVPAVIRRNLSLHDRRFISPLRWRSSLLADRRFATGYISHAGFFFSKVVAGRCARIVLRESGLNNYTALPVPPLKAVLRAVSGLSPRRQIWGEAAWIGQIEVARPQDLPLLVRGKAVQNSFAQVMQALPAIQSQALAQAFLDAPLPIFTAPQPTALLLSQPLEQIGMGDAEAKQALYAELATELRRQGFQIYLKQHPREARFDLPNSLALPARFPIEAWPYCAAPRFDLAVAICSAALDMGNNDFAKRNLQLVAVADFNAPGYRVWRDALSSRLAGALAAWC
jgi:hypothetical protein